MKNTAGRRVRLLLCLVMISIMLSGCWNYQEPQSYSYISALGLEYVDKEYITYAQILDFSSIVRQEGASASQPTPIYIGEGRGRTITEAMNQLYSTSQKQILWGHITALVISENVLRHGVEEALDLINRYREVRYNTWVFGTKQPIEELFASTPLFNANALVSILHEPANTYKQRSIIEPVYLYRFIQRYREPGETSYLPSLTTNTNHWISSEKDKLKKHKLLQVDGAYFIRSDGSLAGWIKNHDLFGIQWLNRHTARAPVTLYRDNDLLAVVVLTRPIYEVEASFHDHKVYFNIEVKLKGIVNELHENISSAELEKATEEAIRSQIRRTFDEGMKIRADIFRLGEVVYRDHLSNWKNIRETRDLVVEPDSLKQIKVKVNIRSSGKYKLRT